MRLSLIIIMVTFFCGKTLSQEWNIYSNIDSLGNIIKPYDYISENEIIKMFNVYNFRIEAISFENASLLPLQLVSNNQIKLERVPFYDGPLRDSDLYFIGKLAIKNEKLSHYLFAGIVDIYYTTYYLFNYYSGEIKSVMEICSTTYDVFLPEFSYRLNSKFIFPNREIILKYDYYDFYEPFNETKKVSISDTGHIRLIEIIRN